MRLGHQLASAILITLFALQGFAQSSQSDSGSAYALQHSDPCTTMTDVCHAHTNLQEVPDGLILLLEDSRPAFSNSETTVASIPPEDGLEIVKVMTGVQYREASEFVSADPDVALPASRPDLRRQESPPSPEFDWQHVESIDPSK